MKRRAAAIAIATSLLVAAGSSFAGSSASADTGPVSTPKDSSGCVVLLPDSASPIYACLFPR